MAQVQSLDDGIFSLLLYAYLFQEQVVHRIDGRVISRKRQIQYKERVENSMVTQCVDFFRALLKWSSKKTPSTKSMPAQSAATTHDTPPTISPIHLVDDETMVYRFHDDGEGQELSEIGGFAGGNDTDDEDDVGFDDMGMFAYEGDSGMGSVGPGDGRRSLQYQSTGAQRANDVTNAAGFIPSTPIPQSPSLHESPYLTPSPKPTQKQSIAFDAKSSPSRHLHLELATPPSSPPTTRSNDVSDQRHIDTYDPKDGLKVFWRVEEVKRRYAVHLGVQSLTSRNREEVRRFGNEVLSLVVLERIGTSPDVEFVDILFNGYFILM